MSSDAVDLFNNYEYLDFFDDDFLTQHELHDCYLSDEELVQFLTPSQNQWRDFFPDNNEAVITFDSSKIIQWDLGKQEIKHICKQVLHLLSMSDFDDVKREHIISHCIGPESKFGVLFCSKIGLDRDTYLKFMSTLCIQAAYAVTSRQLYNERDLLKNIVPMKENENNEIWKNLSLKKGYR